MTKRKISKAIDDDDDEFEEPPDPELEKILDDYIALQKVTMPSEETIKRVFEASGGRCQCSSADCKHVYRCLRTFEWRDRSPSYCTPGYPQWVALPLGDPSRCEIVCDDCRTNRDRAERERNRMVTP